MEMIIGLILAGFVAHWVYGDATKRGNAAGLWAFGVFILMIIFLPLYLVMRNPLPMLAYYPPIPSMAPVLCSGCGRYSASGTVFCPHCGLKIIG